MRYIGVGAIATAGIFGILKSLRVVLGSFAIAFRAFRRGEGHVELERTDRDISIVALLVGVVVSSLAVAAFCGSLGVSWLVVLVGLALVLLFSSLLHLGGGQRVSPPRRETPSRD